MNRKFLVGVAFCLLVFSCFGKDEEAAGGGGTGYYSCASTTSGMCVEGSDSSAVTSACSGWSLTTTSSYTCSAFDFVGTCTVASLKFTFYNSIFDSTNAPATCSSMGGTYYADIGGGAGADGTTSAFQRCAYTGGAICVSYTGSAWTSSVESACTGSSNSLVSSCPTGGTLLGKCNVPNASNLEMVWFYYSGGTPSYNSSSAEAACSGQSGTWVP
jgi:hypothetical protein